MYKIYIFISKLKVKRIFLLILLLPVYIYLYKILSPRVSAFGCFDDCSNIVAGYFMLHGKTIYSQIFFNHQVLMACISFLIQLVFHPVNLYELILRHRQIVFLVGLLFDGLLIYRFGSIGLCFTLLYEFSKFYIFGDRFLAEAVLVYPLVYLFGLVWVKLKNIELSITDYVLAGIFCWFIFFMREPYVPVVIAIYITIVYGKNDYRKKIVSLAICASLTIITFLVLPIKEYLYQVYTVNNATQFTNEISTQNTLSIQGLLKMFFYPVYLYIDGIWNFFRVYIVVVDSVFLLLLFFYLLLLKNGKPIFIGLLLLGISNIRVVPPGIIFYGSFHMLPWYGMFLFMIFLLLQGIYRYRKKFGIGVLSILGMLFLYLILSPQSYIRENINRQSEFITNYGTILQVGEVVRILSNTHSTLFLDGSDDLIYWQAKRLSPYKYSWYTSVMPRFSEYQRLRLFMFNHSPPDFYYEFCTKHNLYHSSLPENMRAKYVRLFMDTYPTCLYINKTALAKVSALQWNKAKDFHYSLH